MLACLPHNGRSGFVQILAAWTIRLDDVCEDATGGHWDVLQMYETCGESLGGAKLRGEVGVVGSKSGKQTLVSRTNTYASNMH